MGILAFSLRLAVQALGSGPGSWVLPTPTSGSYFCVSDYTYLSPAPAVGQGLSQSLGNCILQ